MRLFQRRRCVDCGTAHDPMIEYATRQWVCAVCAWNFGYYEVMQSVAEWLHGKSLLSKN